MSCTLENIKAIYTQEKEYPINKRGEAIGLSVYHGKPKFSHWECTKCNIRFGQVRAVLSHLGVKP